VTGLSNACDNLFDYNVQILVHLSPQTIEHKNDHVGNPSHSLEQAQICDGVYFKTYDLEVPIASRSW
jgi:hypothetical protein